MRATSTLVAVTAAVAVALAGAGDVGTGPKDARSLVAAGAVVVPEDVTLALPPGFDGRLHADPDSGCFRLHPEDGRTERVVPVDEEALRAVPEPFREPWPLCDHPELEIQLRPEG